MKRDLCKGHLHSIVILGLIGLLLTASMAFGVEVTPGGSGRDHSRIQDALDDMNSGDTIRLKGDFVFEKTIYLPSNITWILDGTLTVHNSPDFDEAGINEGGVDSRKETGITEKSGGRTNIVMMGGVYDGNNKVTRFINFTELTNSKFQDMTIKDAGDDGFTLGAKASYNECRNLTGTGGNNALTDKGSHNKWYDCLAEDCASDGWTPKCSFSEFYRCVGRNNATPGWGIYAKVDGANRGYKAIGNKFYDIESYGNGNSGFSFNISANCTPGAIIRDNYISGIFYDNYQQGVLFRNKPDDGIVENNEVDIIVYENQGNWKNSDGISDYAGGLTADGNITSLTGSVVAYDNVRYDLNLMDASDCDLTVYVPADRLPPVIVPGDGSNKIEEMTFVSPSETDAWCVSTYCQLNGPIVPIIGTDITRPLIRDGIKLMQGSHPIPDNAGTFYSVNGRNIAKTPGHQMPAYRIAIEKAHNTSE